jgi:hypothetical protein
MFIKTSFYIITLSDIDFSIIFISDFIYSNHYYSPLKNNYVRNKWFPTGLPSILLVKVSPLAKFIPSHSLLKSDRDGE